MFQIPFKKTHPNAVSPCYAKPGDAGMDLTAVEIINNEVFQITYDTGIAVEIPQGYVGLVFPRSSIRKYDVSLTNSVGVIDSGYRGSIQATFKKNKGVASKVYAVGERIAQIIIVPFPFVTMIETDSLSETSRGEGGFGSTGV